MEEKTGSDLDYSGPIEISAAETPRRKNRKKKRRTFGSLSPVAFELGERKSTSHCWSVTAYNTRAHRPTRAPPQEAMGVFFHDDDDENPPNPSKSCKCLSTALRDALSLCRNFKGKLSFSRPEEDDCTMGDFDDDEEVVVSEIRTRAMEKLRKKPNFTIESFSCVFSPHMGEGEPGLPKKDGVDEEEDQDKEEFISVRSCFTCWSNATSKEAFLSVKTNFSRCSSFNELEFQDLRRRSIIQEFCHCEGWPFGLCRKLLLLPPLPKSPSESWSWRRGKKMKRVSPYI